MSNEEIHLYNISSVKVNVFAHNKVGIGEPAEKIVLPNIIECCVSSSVPSLAPRMKDGSPNANKNMLLIYGM